MPSTWILRVAGVAVLCGLLVFGCKKGPGTVFAGPAKPPPSVDPRLVSADTRFGFKLFGALLQEHAGANVFISPSSIAFALAMTYNGAQGETQQAMAKALELDGLTPDQVNAANAALRANLQNPDPEVALTVANSLWARKGVAFKPAFLDVNKRCYDARVTDLDFRAPSAADTINGWVDKQTRGKIPSIVSPPINGDSILFLINAVYFKGRWTDVFKKANTKDEPFTTLDGARKTVPMMSQSGKYDYLETGDLQGISLPYGHERMSLYLLLPKSVTGLKKLCDSLTAEQWEGQLSQFQSREGTIKLPRFRAECDFSLNDALKALGMGVAFDDQRADFGAMCPIPPNVWIEQVKHKTFVEVNEEGTEAAAVTSVEMGATAAPMEPEPPFKMVVDHPFFCAIRDNETGTILFMGAIVDPK